MEIRSAGRRGFGNHAGKLPVKAISAPDATSSVTSHNLHNGWAGTPELPTAGRRALRVSSNPRREGQLSKAQGGNLFPELTQFWRIWARRSSVGRAARLASVAATWAADASAASDVSAPATPADSTPETARSSAAAGQDPGRGHRPQRRQPTSRRAHAQRQGLTQGRTDLLQFRDLALSREFCE